MWDGGTGLEEQRQEQGRHISLPPTMRLCEGWATDIRVMVIFGAVWVSHRPA